MYSFKSLKSLKLHSKLNNLLKKQFSIKIKFSKEHEWMKLENDIVN